MITGSLTSSYHRPLGGGHFCRGQRCCCEPATRPPLQQPKGPASAKALLGDDAVDISCGAPETISARTTKRASNQAIALRDTVSHPYFKNKIGCIKDSYVPQKQSHT